MIHAEFESILVPEDNEEQNLDVSYANMLQKRIACSYNYKLVCADEKLSNSTKTIR